jgi:branched-chain amino acid transport system ATP-binding protein
MALLEAVAIRKEFGTLRALDNVDLTVERRQIHGLIGPNGSGKSTLLKCIAGAELPGEGR